MSVMAVHESVCEDAVNCQYCLDATCPCQDDHLDDSCVGPAHQGCHELYCRNPECWLDI